MKYCSGPQPSIVHHNYFFVQLFPLLKPQLPAQSGLTMESRHYQPNNIAFSRFPLNSLLYPGNWNDLLIPPLQRNIYLISWHFSKTTRMTRNFNNSTFWKTKSIQGNYFNGRINQLKYIWQTTSIGHGNIVDREKISKNNDETAWENNLKLFKC